MLELYVNRLSELEKLIYNADLARKQANDYRIEFDIKGDETVDLDNYAWDAEQKLGAFILANRQLVNVEFKCVAILPFESDGMLIVTRLTDDKT